MRIDLVLQRQEFGLVLLVTRFVDILNQIFDFPNHAVVVECQHIKLVMDGLSRDRVVQAILDKLHIFDQPIDRLRDLQT
ncbi:hypothetical protein D3C72_2417510 [compost metagenome]